MTAYLVIDAQGEHYSTGTVVADSLPAGWSTVEITDEGHDALRAGAARWDGSALVSVDPAPDPLAEAADVARDSVSDLPPR